MAADIAWLTWIVSGYWMEKDFTLKYHIQNCLVNSLHIICVWKRAERHTVKRGMRKTRALVCVYWLRLTPAVPVCPKSRFSADYLPEPVQSAYWNEINSCTCVFVCVCKRESENHRFRDKFVLNSVVFFILFWFPFSSCMCIHLGNPGDRLVSAAL